MNTADTITVTLHDEYGDSAIEKDFVAYRKPLICAWPGMEPFINPRILTGADRFGNFTRFIE